MFSPKPGPPGFFYKGTAMRIQRFFVLMSLFALTGIGCGGSSKDKPSPAADAGIIEDAGIISDSGIIEEDSGIAVDDAGIAEDDAGITEDDGGIIENDAGHDAGIDDPDGGPAECGGGLHDGGDGQCVPLNTCSEGYHDGGSGDCTAAGTCSTSYQTNTAGDCVPMSDTFITIPAGSFVLLSFGGYFYLSDSTTCEGDCGSEEESTCTCTATLESFKMGKTPVTVAQFEQCVAAGVCTDDYEHFMSFEEVYHPLCNYNRGDAWKNHPMNCVDWWTAKAYCEWIGGRLPTAEEWEYAATHNGTAHLNTRYAFGNTLEHCVNATYFDSTASYGYCVEGQGTSAVGTYSPAGDSPLGLVDMTGNVWEWTSSAHLSSAYAAKGGSWHSDDEQETGLISHLDKLPITNNEYIKSSGATESTLGFRCVKSAR